MEKKKYTVAQAGLGNRGRVHLRGIKGNSDRLELAAVCDIDKERLDYMAKEFEIDPKRAYPDADAMLAEVKPDIFVFVTQPHIRLDMVKLAVKHNIKAMAFEKPMATSLSEAAEITELCEKNNIKTVVSHQQKYLTSMQKLKQIIDSKEIGAIAQMNVSTQAWMSQLGTHFMDYALWANGGDRASWVVGHVHGRGKLADSHPSPDYIMGQVAFAGGVRLFLENGYLSKSTVKNIEPQNFWVDNRLTVYGERGYVWAETNGAWGALTNGQLSGEQGGTWGEQEPGLQTPYFTDFVNWLDDDSKIHPCNISITYHGYEILEALCVSALDKKPVYLPADPQKMPDIIERMKKELE
ncbi:MAG: Gfo/Idh/MocA family oxidoreductase [Oscillospiraceae bacterium]|nr:Gfo/Idh/MocA family oxidoreductase [Oscillospiraceae bacterium]